MDRSRTKIVLVFSLLVLMSTAMLVSCLHLKAKESSTSEKSALSTSTQEVVQKTAMEAQTPPTQTPPTPTPSTPQVTSYKNPDGQILTMPSSTQKIIYQNGKYLDPLPNDGQPLFIEFHLAQEKWGLVVPKKSMQLFQRMEKPSKKVIAYSIVNTIRLCGKFPNESLCHRRAAEIMAEAQNGVMQ